MNSDKPRIDRPRKLHRSVDPELLDDAVVVNEREDGFRLLAHEGDRLVVVRARDGRRCASVVTVLKVADASDPNGLVSTYDETTQQMFEFTPNEVGVYADAVQVKLLGESRVVYA